MKLTCSTLPPPELVEGRVVKEMRGSLKPTILPSGGTPGLNADFAVHIFNPAQSFVDTAATVTLLEENSGKSTQNLKVKPFGVASKRRGLKVFLDRETLRRGTLSNNTGVSELVSMTLDDLQRGVTFIFGIDLRGARHEMTGSMRVSKKSKTQGFGRGLRQILTGSTDYYFTGSDRYQRRIVFHFKSQGAGRFSQENAYQLEDIQLYLPDNYDKIRDIKNAGSDWDFKLYTSEISQAEAGLADALELNNASIDRARLMALGRYLGELNQTDISAEITHHCNTNMDCEQYRVAELSKAVQDAVQQYY